MKCNTEFFTGSNSKKINFAKKMNQPHIDLSIQEFMKAITVAYIRNNDCLPAIRFKQEVNLKTDTKGEMKGTGFSIASYYENSQGMKVPVDEAYGKTFIEALIKANGSMPYPPTVSEYDPDNKFYPYTEDIFTNISTYLLQDKDRRITISPDPAKINGKPNMVISFSTVDTPYLNGGYDNNNFHVICLGVTNVLEALKIAEKTLPEIEQFRASHPDCFITDAAPFGYPLTKEPLTTKELHVLPIEEERTDADYMPEEYDIQGELMAKGLFDTQQPQDEYYVDEAVVLPETISHASKEENDILAHGGFKTTPPSQEDGGQIV